LSAASQVTGRGDEPAAWYFEAMFVVALLALGTPAEVEAAALAGDLGITAFEAGQLVRGFLPSVVLRTPDLARAQALGRALHGRGHHAVMCDTAQVAASSAMQSVRVFRLQPDALVAVGPTGEETFLPFADVVAVVRAVHRSSGAKTAVTREKKFDIGRAVLTQGLSMHKTVEKQTSQTVEEREPVVYLFRTSGPPWLLTETGCRYDGLGPHLRPVRLENFNTLVRLLREACPAAPYDERLVRARQGGEQHKADFTGHQTSSSSAGQVDLLAHLVAVALVRQAAGAN
jgi:hypothetical protein